MQAAATAEAHTALTLVQAAAASRGESVMAAKAAANNALNADATEVEAQVPTIAGARTALTLVCTIFCVIWAYFYPLEA